MSAWQLRSGNLRVQVRWVSSVSHAWESPIDLIMAHVITCVVCTELFMCSYQMSDIIIYKPRMHQLPLMAQ